MDGLEIVNVGGVFTLRLSAGYATQSVASITSPTVAEGATMIFNISLSGATAQVQQFPFTLAGTATPGTDYATPLVFSNGVTISGTNLSIPIGVSSFTASTLTSTDALVEPTETVILTIGGITGTGSILDVQASGVTWDGGASTWDGGTTIWTS